MVAHPDETLRAVAERMATRHVFVLPVTERGSGRVVGVLSAEDVLLGRTRTHERENNKVRVRQPFRKRPAV